jgi:cobalt-precorrin 5A hydrolase
MITAGLGCRRACAPEDVVAAITAALACAGRNISEVSALYAPAARMDASALRAAAAQLGKRLEFVALERLAQHSEGALTHSERVLSALGIPSAAETAALAGACAQRPGSSARLLGPRSSAGGATCALAMLEEK